MEICRYLCSTVL